MKNIKGVISELFSREEEFIFMKKIFLFMKEIPLTS